MSRKTRKLMWSVPLIAAVAVIGALALFMTLQPNGASAQAQTVEVPGPVEGLKATAKSRNSIELTWGLPKSSDVPTGYRIDDSADNLIWKRLIDNTGNTDRSKVITDDVDTDTRRHYRVFAINEAGTGQVSNNPVTAFVAVADTFAATTPIASTLVLTLSIDPADSNTVVLNWTKPTTRGAAIVSYTAVEMVDEPMPDLSTPRTACTGGDCLQQENIAPDTTTVKHPMLITGTQHYYRVTALSESQDNIHSNVVGITLGNLSNPDAPTNVVAVPLTGGGVELYWIGPARNGGHDLAVLPIVEGRTRANSNVNWEPWLPVSVMAGAVAEAFNASISNAADGEWEYQVRVQQNNDPTESGLDKMSSWSRRSNRITVPLSDTQNRVPLAPTLTAEDLVVETRREQGIGLTWTFDTSADTTDLNTPSNYRIDRSKDGLTWSVAQRDTVTLKQWNDKGSGGLTEGVPWHYRLFPLNGSTYGQADYDMRDVRAADIPASSLVFSLTAAGISQTAIKLDWTKPAAVHDGFDIYVATLGSDGLPPITGAEGAYEELTSVAGNVTTYMHDKGLGPEQSRWYRAVATYKGDPIADGPEAIGTTLPAGNPDTGDGATGTPVDLTTEEAKDSSFTLARDRGVLLLWNAPVEKGKFPHDVYTVQRKVNDGDWETIEEYTDSDATHYTDEEEPAEDEQRAYRVRSRSVKGQSDWSNVADYPPMASMAELGMPGNTMSLMAGSPDDNDPGAIKLTWEAGANATTHTVAGVLRNADGTFDTSAAIWMTDVASPLEVEMGDRPAGTYIFGVVAGLIDGTDQEWSDWARATVAYPQ